jgi:hypothetical protein
MFNIMSSIIIHSEPLDMRGEVLNSPVQVGGLLRVVGYGECRVVGVREVRRDCIVLFVCPVDIEDWIVWPVDQSLSVVVCHSDVFLSGLLALKYPWIK